MDRRVGIGIALLAVSAFGAGFLCASRTGDSVPTSLPAPSVDAETAAPARAPSTSEALSAPPAAGRSSRSVGTAADESPALPDRSPNPRNQVVLDGLHPGVIRVRVTDVDGKAVPGAHLIAVPEGGGARGWVADPTATTDALGRADLAVPVAGRYAVMVQADLRVAVREGVPATEEGGTELELVVGRLANLEVRRTGAAEGARWTVGAEGRQPRLADGTVIGLRPSRSVSTGEDSVVLTLPENVPFRMEVEPESNDPRWTGRTAAGPLKAEMSAPGSWLVGFRARTAADDPPKFVKVEVEVTLLPETGRLPPCGRVGYAFRQRFGESPSRESSEGWIDWGPSDTTPSAWHSEWSWPPGTPGLVEWTVAGVPGVVEVPARAAGEVIRLKGEVRIPPSAVETTSVALEVLDGRGAPLPVGGPWETSVTLFTGDGQCCSTNGVTAEDDVRRGLRDNIGKTFTAERGWWWVSRPGSITADGRLRLQLELGGYLLVHIPKPPRAGLGTLTVERTDGAHLGIGSDHKWLPTPAEDGQEGPWRSEAVGNGTMLGPLPPGDVELVFRVGAPEVGRTTAHVVAGEVSILTIR